MKRLALLALAAGAMLAGCGDQPGAPTETRSTPDLAAGARGTIGVNVVLKGPATDAQRAQLNSLGTILDELPEINGIHMSAAAGDLATIRKLSFVAAAGEDGEVTAAPITPVEVTDFTDTGINAWDQDAVNVTDFGSGRVLGFTGEGVYVAILDTGLLPTWPAYFPDDRIRADLAKSFGGGGALPATISEQPDKWEKDVNSHGTHVTSSILGYRFIGLADFNGVAPKANVIPVKVLNQAGFGFFSVVAHGIIYVANLKAPGGPLFGSPVIVSMSLGAPVPDPLMQAAIDFAEAQGVIVVAAAGNSGNAGMDWPGAFPEVISAAAAGWVGQWRTCPTNPTPLFVSRWWRACDVPEAGSFKKLADFVQQFYIAPFSSRSVATNQDLDVAAPGAWVVGPFQTQQGKTSYFFLSGTSMATPHVSGIVALMAQKKPSLTPAEAETILESAALPLGKAGTTRSRTITNPNGSTVTVSWGDNAEGAGLITADAALAATP